MSEEKPKSPRSYEDYRNPDPRCCYPFTPDFLGYCWSYAHHVDGTKGYEDMERICPGCHKFDSASLQEGTK